ncbi:MULTISPECIES: aldo/keto reductase [unclassified Microcella]|uniref:aldo/keto reductase n=1 Tax=unclassified Microcella TaxID=2630066 RepID=UPI0006FDCDA2|nr:MULTISPECIES: aldo/keto reductase [unclassified Microcella]KQV24626.1 dehydratase [Yonghaparkia sp. Root332]KRF30916.1 dehydratase [Yonghaparkia sp. Soil809]
MKLRTLGNSGTAVSDVALGTMTFGAEADEASSHAMLDAFAEAGGTLIDAADVYAGGLSEEIIGRWMAANPDVADRMVIATKGRFPMGSDANDLGTSRRHLRRALDASLRRLGVEHVDLYQLHAWDPITPLDETLGFLDDAVRSGLISYWGLSNFTGWQLTKAVHRAAALGMPAPVTLQPQYSLLSREIEFEIVPAALDAGLGLLPWGPLAGGWLTGKYRRDAAPTGATRLGEDPNRGVEAYARRSAEDRTWEVLEALHAIADDHGVPPSRIALAWLQSRPGMTSVILGARTVEQLRDNLAAADVELTAEQLDRLDAASAPRVPDYPYGELGVEQRARRL